MRVCVLCVYPGRGKTITQPRTGRGGNRYRVTDDFFFTREFYFCFSLFSCGISPTPPPPPPPHAPLFFSKTMDLFASCVCAAASAPSPLPRVGPEHGTIMAHGVLAYAHDRVYTSAWYCLSSAVLCAMCLYSVVVDDPRRQGLLLFCTISCCVGGEGAGG